MYYCTVQEKSILFAYLESLIETLHHADPLSSLFGELARLNLESLHLVVQFTLVYIRLCNTFRKINKQKNQIKFCHTNSEQIEYLLTINIRTCLCFNAACLNQRSRTICNERC